MGGWPMGSCTPWWPRLNDVPPPTGYVQLTAPEAIVRKSSGT
ncbi:MAG: hypothetical protein R3A10_18515 [Caldilineaceae bacterium]